MSGSAKSGNLKTTVHWLGAGLSSAPGILELARDPSVCLILWNRTLSKAHEVLSLDPGVEVEAREYSLDALKSVLSQGDIVVSMLPAPMHPEIALVCLDKRAHLVTTSYISPKMRELSALAQAKGVCLVNECGLDPGIDHMFAHLLISDLKSQMIQKGGSQKVEVELRSFCGGVPADPGPFFYKFSWSPVGVLRALKNQARYIMKDIGGAKIKEVSKPWEALEDFQIGSETFEVYPNRDSIPYIEEYHLDPNWDVSYFMRGTLRLKGWKNAWSEIFKIIPQATDSELEALSSKLWDQYAYADGERDRVVLFVELKAKISGNEVFSKHYVIDQTGSGRFTAMAVLVSRPAALAVKSLIEGDFKAGVSGAPESPELIKKWLRAIGNP